MATTPPAQRKPKKKANPLRAGQNIDYKDVATLRKCRTISRQFSAPRKGLSAEAESLA